MLERLKADIIKHHMISAGSRVLVGISGGMDSVALLHSLHALRQDLEFSLWAAHFNHGLRGTESDEDALFVTEFCRQMAIPLVSTKKMLGELAAGENLENFSRKMRYGWLQQQKERLGADLIAVAHHAQDQAETLLLHLLRGSGLEGLAAMSPVEGDIIRPFLFLDRKEIEGYCREQGLVWREDSSNRELAYRRNRIRQELLPQLAVYNPRIVESLSVTTDICRIDNDFLNDAARKKYDGLAEKVAGGCRLPYESLLQLHPALQRRILRMAANLVNGEQGLPYQQVNDLLILSENKELHLASDLYGYRRQGWLYLTREMPEKPQQNSWGSYPQPVPGEVFLPEAGYWAKAYWGKMPTDPLPERGLLLALPRDLAEGLHWRSRRQGDILSPRGMVGRRKLKNLLIDCKIAAEKRDVVPILLWREEIVWVPGCRMAKAAGHLNGEALFVELFVKS